METKDLMLDLETLGTPPDAAILSIGAVWFEIESGELGEQFYQTIDLDDAMHYGTVDPETLRWWIKQSRSAQIVFEKTANTARLSTALSRLNRFIKDSECENVNLWGNGATFDCTILEHAYHQIGLDLPIPFRNYRDVRTVVDLGRRIKNIDPKNELNRPGTHHNALDDALFQAAYIMDVIEVLRGFCECKKDHSIYKIGTPCEGCGGMIPGIIIQSDPTTNSHDELNERSTQTKNLLT